MVLLNLIAFSEQSAERQELGAVTEKIEAWMTIVEQRSLFEVLSLHWICTASEVEQAHEKAKSLLAQYTSQASEAEKIALQTIAQSVEHAHQVLSIDSQRRNYRKQIFTGEELRDASLILEKRAQKAVGKMDKTRALAAYSKAIELTPENQELRRALVAARELS